MHSIVQDVVPLVCVLRLISCIPADLPYMQVLDTTAITQALLLPRVRALPNAPAIGSGTKLKLLKLA